jgi:hypothetical protein
MAIFGEEGFVALVGEHVLKKEPNNFLVVYYQNAGLGWNFGRDHFAVPPPQGDKFISILIQAQERYAINSNHGAVVGPSTELNLDHWVVQELNSPLTP